MITQPILRGLLSWHLMLKVFLGPLLGDVGIQCHAFCVPFLFLFQEW